MAAWHEGRWVAHLYGGHVDAAHTRPWRADSIVMPYSVTKPFAAVCLLTLVDRGLVGLDEPMQTYWPELVAPATVRQVLSHQAGLVALDDPLPTEAFYDCLGWASQVGGYAYGFVTGTVGTHDRSDIVENTLRSCLGLPPIE